MNLAPTHHLLHPPEINRYASKFPASDVPNANHTQIIKKYFPIINRKLYFFTNYWNYSLIVRPIATPTPVGLDVALPTEGGRARSLRSHVATIPYSALASPIPALPWRLRSFPQNVWNSFHAVRRGTNFFRFVYTTHKYHWVNDLSFPTNSQ